MNELGISLLWLVGQVTLLCSATAVIYLIARRRHPSAGAAAALTGLLLSGVLTLSVFSPWPRWSLPDDPQGSTVSSAVDGAARSSHGRTSRPATSDVPAPNNSPPLTDAELESPATAAWTALWQELRQELAEPTPQPARTGFRWSGWLAVSLLLAMVLGAARLLAGWLTVRRCLRRSGPISDRSLNDVVAELCTELGCRRRVAVCESDDVTSAATVGWRKPVILLPRGWRDWSLAERKTVLAHELAHVTAGDAASWLAAQFGLLLHFYHPLVHWLTHRLRLEQELAADALAARITGSANTYLTTLAELAVRQPDRPVAWPARAFLPTRGTLLRRIEMLRDTKAQPQRPSTFRRGTVIALTLAAGLLIAGLRPPAAQQAVAQQPEKAKASAEATPFNLENVPASTTVLLGLRPAQMANRPELQPLFALFEESGELKGTGIHVKNIDQFLIIAVGSLQSIAAPVLELRMTEPTDFAAYIQNQIGETEKESVDGSTLWVLRDETRPARSMAAYVTDDRTVLIGLKEDLLRVVQAKREKAAPVWLDRFAPVSRDHACLVWDVSAARPILQREFRENPGAVFGMFVPLWENAEVLIGGARVDDQLSVTISGWAPDAESAAKLQRTLSSLVPFARGMLESVKTSTQQAPAEMRAMLQQSIELAETALDDSDVQQMDNRVTVTVEGEADSLAMVAAAMLPALKQAREAARRTQTMNNLKQIGLAFHNYNDVFSHFPSSAVFGFQENGKSQHPHSWRVAILPYIDQANLYNQYHFDEPWDSENNRKVLEQMPDVFRSPNDKADSTNTAYFTLVGDHTAVGNAFGKGVTIREITDGTSQTILVVEANRDIPWTKPEDIPYAADKDLPKLGGFHKPGFFALVADGSVRYIADSVDEPTLRALITRDGGEELNSR